MQKGFLFDRLGGDGSVAVPRVPAETNNRSVRQFRADHTTATCHRSRRQLVEELADLGREPPEAFEVLEVFVHSLVDYPGVLVCEDVPKARHLDHLVRGRGREDSLLFEDAKEVTVVLRLSKPLRSDDV